MSTLDSGEAEVTELGTVSSFTEQGEGGYGFILPDAGLPLFFFHIKHFAGTQVHRTPKKGDRVRFTRGRTKKVNKKPRVGAFDFLD